MDDNNQFKAMVRRATRRVVEAKETSTYAVGRTKVAAEAAHTRPMMTGKVVVPRVAIKDRKVVVI